MKKILKKTIIYKWFNERKKTINRIESKITETNNKIDKSVTEIDKNLTEINKKVENLKRICNENLYAMIFNDTIKNSEWFEDTSLSLSSWAIGYPFAYILFKVLDEIKPQNILEMGLGQSSKIINQYVKHSKNVKYDIVEHNEEWIEFLKKNIAMENIHLLKSYTRKYNDSEFNAYLNFSDEFKNYRFDLISIDGPVGGGEKFSRMDIIDLIPNCLKETFVIILDDYERKGEKGTVELLEKKLTQNNIEFSRGFYRGKKDVYICTSKNLDFLCHI